MHIELSKKTAIIINSFFCGSLFAMGLGIGGLMDPQKVMNFLDIKSQAADINLCGTRVNMAKHLLNSH